MDQQPVTVPRSGRLMDVFDVLKVFLKLGLTSFGRPIAHLGYFRREFVENRRWLDDEAYSTPSQRSPPAWG
jgi:chromate transporter